MKKKIVGIFVCMLLIIATVIPVAGNIKMGSTSPLMIINTSVDEISPYLIPSSTLTITATGPSDLDSVTLYYRWSKDNSSWSGIQEISIFEGFESGSQNTSLWSTYQTNNGRIQWDYGASHSGSYSCAMDDSVSGSTYSLNVIYTNIDFTDATDINIEFWEREWGDEAHSPDPPYSWTGWDEGEFDTVAFTNDGNTWYEIVSEASLNVETFTQFQYDISADPDFSSPPNSNFAIAFQQYDNYPLTNDGRAWDDIYIDYTIGAGINWSVWDGYGNPDYSYPWSWNFYFPNSTGYYEFYSIGKKTGEPDETAPMVADARCRFNRKPEIFNENPSNGSTDVELIPQLDISVSDADGEEMTINWYSNSSGTWQAFGSNISIGDGTYSQTNSNFSNFDTTYWWYVTVADGIYTKSSPIYHFTTRVNYPPNTPSDPDPEDGETDVYISTDVSWTGGDPEGDDVTYDVYFGESSPPPIVKTNQTGTSYDPPGLLDFGTTYYWQIVAWDEYSYSTTGSIWSFTTEENQPPYTPSDPIPEDGATDVSIGQILHWIGGDPNPSDSVKYDVYFGTSSPPPLVAVGVTQVAYDPGTMDLETTYYWQVVAEDSQGLSTTGPIWHFTTEVEPNEPPTAPDIYGPPSGPPGKELFWAFTSIDPDGNQLKYIIDWGDGNTFETDYYPEGKAVEASHTYEELGEYTINAKAKDEKGVESEESTFELTIEKTRTRTVYHLLLLRLFERFPMLGRLLDLIRLC